MLDIRTIMMTISAVTIICTVLLAFLWYQSRNRFDGLGLLVADFACQSAATILISLRDFVHDWISIVFANTLVIVGIVLGLIGFQRFFQKRVSNYHNYLFILLFFLIHAYFTFITPDVEFRNLNTSVIFLLLFLQYTWFFRKKLEGEMKRFTDFLTLVFSLFVIVNIFRIVTYFVTPTTTQDFMHAGPVQALFLLSYLLLLILTTFGIGLLVNRCLFAELGLQEEKFSKAFKSSRYALVLSRLSDGLMLDVNDGYENMTGYTAAETIGRKSMEMQLWMENEKREAIVAQIEQKGQVSDEKVMFRRKNGELFWGHLSAQTIATKDEKYMLSSIMDITAREKAREEREELIGKLQKALSEIKTLRGYLPICASCKKVRDDKGYWTQIEAYIRDHSEAEFTHSICPECMKKLYPDLSD